MNSFEDFLKEQGSKEKQEKKKKEDNDTKAVDDTTSPFKIQPATTVS